MKAFWTVLFVALSLGHVHGQDALTGDPQKTSSLYAKVHLDVKGSPFLKDAWEDGTVKMANGTVYADLKLIYNVVDDKPLYQTADERIWEFTSPVEAFTLRKGETFKQGAGGFYEVLVEGKYNLYKKHTKVVFEQRPYGSSTIEQRFRDQATYYTGSLQAPVRIKINRSSLSKYFQDDQANFKEATKGNRLKTEADLLALFELLNAQ